MSILIIGSTGTIGSHVVEEVAKCGYPVSALVRGRNPISALLHGGKEKLPAGATPVTGDVTDIDSMRQALTGIDTLFLLNPVLPDELTRALLTLDLAMEAGIKRVVYFSMFKSDVFLDCPHANAKFATEQMIHKFGIPATILRPNYFFQNDGGPVTKTHAYSFPIGNLGISMVDARDIGEIAAAKLIERDTNGPLPTEIVEIHGPDIITADSAVATWTEVLGKPVTYAGDDLRQFEKTFAGMSTSMTAYDVAGMFRGFQREGMVAPDGAVEATAKLLGRPPRNYRAYAEETAAR
jgi:uncharacterized protein YbjT (DUF2867 family)